eukprot:symbB.v1.2.012126.t1/scaffold827.1/size159509/1
MFVSGEGRDANLCIVASPKKFLAFFDRGKDTAGKYLDAARQRRKEEQLAAKSTPTNEEWPVAELADGFSAEAVTEILMETGDRLSFHGLDKEQRAMVHQLAHHLGFVNSSRTHPVHGRILCVARRKKASLQETSAPEVPSVAASEPRKSRWRRERQEPATATTTPVEKEATAKAVAPAVVLPMAVGRKVLSEGKLRNVCIVWLRDDMRLQDNPALLFATQFQAVVPVFILESATQYSGAACFWKYESLRVFSQTLSDVGSGLLLRGAPRGPPVRPAEDLLQICSECGVAPQDICVAFNRRCASWQQRVDHETTEILEKAGLKVRSFAGNVLYEPQDLQPIERWQQWRKRVREEEAHYKGRTAKNKTEESEHISGFGSYRFFSHALEHLGPPSTPCKAVGWLPPMPPSIKESVDLSFMGNTCGNGFSSQSRQHGIEARGDWAFGIKSWWKVGEEAALQRLQQFLDQVLSKGDFEGRKRLRSDEKNTSELSPYIRFGEISVRVIYAAAKRHSQRTDQKIFANSGYAYDQEKPKSNATFLRRFFWRDLAYWFLWEFPFLPETSLRPQYEEQVWSGTRAQLKRWQRGTTGFPLVDAAMTQLWQVGWMPNYLRHVVAQMLIEYLDITWKRGLEWFEWTLVDADVAINSFMWQNGGHSGPDHWEFVLHPVNAAKSCDPDGSYVRCWLPFLSQCPTEYIHRPWDLPLGRVHGLNVHPPLLQDLDAARRQHCRRVLEVRQKHPDMISRTGHEWLRLPGRKGLLAKLVSRQEFRAETEDFIFYQSRGVAPGRGRDARASDANQAILAEEMYRQGGQL